MIFLVDLVSRLTKIQKLAHDNLIKAKEKSKEYYDKKLNIQEFRIGTNVFLEKGPKPNKLENRYTGPYRVLQVLSNNNVKILTQKGTKVVHPNRLRPTPIKPVK